MSSRTTGFADRTNPPHLRRRWWQPTPTSTSSTALRRPTTRPSRTGIITWPSRSARLSETPAILGNLAVVLKSLDLSPGLHVLDFGAGSGWLARLLTQLGCRVTLLDVSPTALAIAREHYPASQSSAKPRPAVSLVSGLRRPPDRSCGRERGPHRLLRRVSSRRQPGRDDRASSARILVAGRPGRIRRTRPAPSQSPDRVRVALPTASSSATSTCTASGGRRRRPASPTCGCACFTSRDTRSRSRNTRTCSTGGPAGTRWLDSTRKFLHLVRNFVLVKAGEVRADSRTARGLACEIRTAITRDGGRPGCPPRRRDRDEYGDCVLAAVDVPHGGVSLGAHVYDERGSAGRLRGRACGADESRQRRGAERSGYLPRHAAPISLPADIGSSSTASPTSDLVRAGRFHAGHGRRRDPSAG